MADIRKLADEADMIVDGYAFTKCQRGYRVNNLNNPERAAILSNEGQPLEMSMDDIEISIIMDIFQKDKKYMEE